MLRLCVAGARRRRASSVASSSGAFGIEGFEDASAEALFEFEQELDAGEVHAALPGQVADPGEPPDVVLAVEADVDGVRAGQSRPSSS